MDDQFPPNGELPRIIKRRRRRRAGPARNSDGTFVRTIGGITRVTNRSLLARWLESETLRLKKVGLTFAEIAEHCNNVSKGLAQPMTPLNGAEFPADYSVFMTGCHAALQRALAASPRLEADQYKYLQNERTEHMYRAMQPGINSGSPQHVTAAVRVLDHQANINGLTDRSNGGLHSAFSIHIHLEDR